MQSAFLPQPWLYAGLSTLLLPDEARVRELRAPAPSDAQPRTAPRPQARAAAPSAGKAASRPPASAPPALSPDTPEARPLPPAEWPAPWRELLQGRKWPPHPIVLWTYAGLGHDLSGQPQPERREVVAALLQGLRHAPGTHVFWPYALPDAPTEPGPEVMFRSGVELFQPRALVVMGSEARDELHLPRLMPYQYTLAFARRLFMLPQPAGLCGRPDMLQSVLAYLAENLRFCLRKDS